MSLSLTVPASPSAYYNITIEQKPYKFIFRWQTRGRCWYLSIEDRDGFVITRNVKLTPEMQLFRQNLDKAPEGILRVVKTIDDRVQTPGRSNIGPNKDFQLIYASWEELGL